MFQGPGGTRAELELTGQFSCWPSLELASLLSSAQGLGMWHFRCLASLPCITQHLTSSPLLCAGRPVGPLTSSCIRRGSGIGQLYVISEVFIFSTDFSSDVNFPFAYLFKYHGHYKFHTSQSQPLIFLILVNDTSIPPVAFAVNPEVILKLRHLKRVS